MAGIAAPVKPRDGIAVASIIIAVISSSSARLNAQCRRISPSSGCTSASSQKSRKKAAGVDELKPSRVPLMTNSP